MSKWISPTVIKGGALGGFGSIMSQTTGIVLLSGQPLTLASAQGAPDFIMSIKVDPTSNLVTVSQLTSALGSLTVSWALTSAMSALAAGTAVFVGVITSNATLAYVTTCTSQGISIGVPYYNNAMTLTFQGNPT